MHCEFCKLQRNFVFFCSINHLSGPLRKHMFTCDWCISIHFVCFCVSRFAACDRPVPGNYRLSFLRRFFWSFLFLSLARIKQCLPPALDKKSTHHCNFVLLFLSHLESFSVLFLLAKLGIVICINSASTQMIDGTEKPIWSLQTRSAIQRIWL